jgi:hypothetical protein
MKIVYSVVARMAHSIKVTVNQNGFIVSQSMKNFEGTENIYTYDTEVLYADIKARKDFADYSCYNVFEGTVGVFNMFANSKSAKLSGQDFAIFNGKNSAVCLIIPFKNSPVEDWVLSIQAQKDEPEWFELVGATGTAMPTNHCGHSAVREDNLPSVHFDNANISGDTNEVLELPFTVKNADGTTANTKAEVYFETTGGFLPVTRKVAEGNGTAFISLRDVPKGERFKVKAGFKNFSGISECQVTVN